MVSLVKKVRQDCLLRQTFLLVALACCLLILVHQTCAFAQTPKANQQTAAARSTLIPEVSPRARAYHFERRSLFAVSLLWYIAGFFGFIAMGGSVWLRNRVYGVLRTQWKPELNAKVPTFKVIVLFYTAATLLHQFFLLPIQFISHAIEVRYGFATQTIPSLLMDHLIDWLLGLVLIPLVWLGYKLLNFAPKRWWLWVWAAIAPISIAVMYLYPLAINPLFNAYKPLGESELKTKILALATKAGIKETQILVEDTSRRTKHVNAYVIGIGASARIVINDTALLELPEDQLLAMVGHEIGHFIEGHVWLGTLAAIAGSGFLLFIVAKMLPICLGWFQTRQQIAGLNDIAALPIFFLMVFGLNLLGEPVLNSVSRTFERRADRYGLQLTQLHTATAQLFAGFATRDFSDPSPPALFHFWFGSHPTLSERIEFALKQDAK